MRYLQNFIVWTAFVFLLNASSIASTPNYDELSIDDLKTQAPSLHPVGLYILASRLFEAGEKDEAVMWYYAGQLRFRFHLLANPDLPRSGDPALFSAMNAVVGFEINKYAGGHPPSWIQAMHDAVLWDADTPNNFTSKTQHSTEYAQIIKGVEDFITYAESEADNIRQQRTEQGLENR